ncbi:hypothetical protein BH09BAC3_BH09BAC3_01460 [soil metagenome]
MIFAANHQNAFMDALLIVCFTSQFTHFLARADIFTKRFTRWMLGTLNMIPIYRIRDGRRALSENANTFDACYHLFAKNEAVVIFPEGNHGSQRRVRPLSRGFTKIVAEAQLRDPNLKISIVPVGLNYSSHQEFRSSVSIHFGKPITTGDFPFDANALRVELYSQLKTLTTHIDDLNHIDETYQKLIASGVDFLDPEDSNSRISQIQKGENIDSQIANGNGSAPLLLPRYVAITINFFPLLLWRKIKSRIKDPVFITSLRFGIGIFAFPAFYFFIGAIAWLSVGKITSLLWMVVSFPSMLFYKK